MQGKVVWSEFAPILGKGKKRVLEINICKGGLCQMRKMFAGESQPSNGLAFPQITRSAGIFWLSELTSKSEG